MHRQSRNLYFPRILQATAHEVVPTKISTHPQSASLLWTTIINCPYFFIYAFENP
ncbi:hypothetical protein M3J09_007965 [Ascochyta lentis]